MKRGVIAIVCSCFVIMELLAFTGCAVASTQNDGHGPGMWGDEFPDEPVYTSDMPEYHNKQGQSYFGRKQYELAFASFQEALEIDPSNSNAYYGLAMTHRAQGRVDLAIINYGKVIRLSPDYAQPYELRAELYQCIGRFDQAEKDLDSFVRLYGQYPVPYMARGDFFMARNEYARAAEDYAMAIERNPNLQEAYLKSAEALLLSGRQQEASAVFAQALALAKAE